MFWLFGSLLTAACQTHADLGREIFDDDDRNDQCQQVRTDLCPAHRIDRNDKGGTDAAGTDEAQDCRILQVDIEAVDDRRNERCGQLGQDAAADLLERGAAGCVQGIEDARIKIFDRGDVHLRNHADGADGLRNDAAEGTRSRDPDPHQCPYKGRNGTDQKNQDTEDDGDGARNDVVRCQEGNRNRKDAAEQCAENGNGDRLEHQVENTGLRHVGELFPVRMHQAVDRALCNLDALRHAVEVDAAAAPDYKDQNNGEDDNVADKMMGLCLIHFFNRQFLFTHGVTSGKLGTQPVREEVNRNDENKQCQQYHAQAAVVTPADTFRNQDAKTTGADVAKNRCGTYIHLEAVQAVRKIRRQNLGHARGPEGCHRAGTETCHRFERLHVDGFDRFIQHLGDDANGEDRNRKETGECAQTEDQCTDIGNDQGRNGADNRQEQTHNRENDSVMDDIAGGDDRQRKRNQASDKGAEQRHLNRIDQRLPDGVCVVEVGTEDLGKNFAHLGDSRCEGGPVEAGHLQTYGDDNDQDDSDQRSAGAGPVDRMTVWQRNELRLEDAVK